MEKNQNSASTREVKDFLVQSFENRLAKNSAYSLRSFARDLTIDPSQLSAAMKAKKGLSLIKASQIASKLGYSQSETKYFLLAVSEQHGRSAKSRSQAKEEIRLLKPEMSTPFQTLTFDHYNAISDWHNLAIFEYLRRPRANQDFEVIAQQFQISDLQVKESIHRLERLQMLKKRNGRYFVTEQAFSSPDGIPSEALKKHHSQILKKADEALYFQSVEDRAFSSTQLVIKQDQLPEMKKFLRDTLKEFCARFAQNGSGDAVYEFSHQLFELGKIKLKTKETL